MAKGFLSLAFLAGITVGVPLVLVHFGTPIRLPVHLTARGVLHAFTTQLPDSFWPEALTMTSWGVWLWFVVAAVVEFLNRMRRRVTGANPSARGARGVAGRLFSNIAVLSVLAHGLAGQLPAGAETIHSAAPPASVTSRTAPQPTATVVPRQAYSAQAPPSDSANRSGSETGIAKDPFGSAGSNRFGTVVLRKTPASANDLGFGMFGVCAVGALDKLRRTQQRRRPTDGALTPPAPELRNVERILRSGITSGRCLDPVSGDLIDDAEWIARAVGLAQVLVDGEERSSQHGATGRIAGVRSSPDWVELVFEAPSIVVPPPFAPGPQGTWVLMKVAECAVPAHSDASIHGFPPLIRIGTSDVVDVFVNLAALRLVNVTGDPDRCLGFLRRVALELATSPWGSHCEVYVDEGDVRCGHVWNTRGLADLPGAACGDALDTPLPAVVVAFDGERVKGAVQALLVGDVDREGSVHIIGRNVADIAQHRIDLDGERCEVPLLSDQVEVSVLPAEQGRAVSSLLDAASLVSAGSAVAPTESLHVARFREPGHAAPDGAATRPTRDVPRETAVVRISVLGQVEVTGNAKPFARARALDLAVYLTMHPDGVERMVWAEAMWPGRRVPRPTIDSTVSDARSALGCAADGTHHLPTGRGRLRLGPSVVSDWSTFLHLSGDRGEEALASWEAALALIRGRPFDGLPTPDWIYVEGIGAYMESVVVDTAVRVAEYRLSSRDPDRAQWAARRALVVCPYDERLFRMLMKASDQQGNRAGVVSVMEELRIVVEDFVDPFDAVHPETVELYAELLGVDPDRVVRSPLRRRSPVRSMAGASVI